MSFTTQKRTGAHFTPAGLASIVAERLVESLGAEKRPLRILDPACGDGNLLVAIAQCLPPRLLSRCTLIGIEQDRDSFVALQSRLADFHDCETELLSGDFLDFFDDRPLFGPTCAVEPVDVIIANPPYVRTQVLGAARAQELAATFGLSGRVDLYHAFLVAMSPQLKQGGLLGVITSNRFLTTKGGAATRQLLRSQFELLEVVDLGDTKLFEAAVLPALIFARRRSTTPRKDADAATRFLRVYEEKDERRCTKAATSIIELLRKRRPGCYTINGNKYHVSTGQLTVPDDSTVPWTMQTTNEKNWVRKVNASASCKVGQVAQIRVGIKTTADKVFIRRDWESLPKEQRPEEKYLRVLVSQDETARWSSTSNGKKTKRVLYTHEVVSGKRRAIPFDKDSTAWKYLVSHRSDLESRRYVLDAGRKWYEIWVPQDPRAWRQPKIVFPDISPEARFFLDRSGCIVDGNCYWITTHDPEDEDLLLLILGVANSAMMARYHDLCFQNRLYAQRRRYLTQYVQEYPLPSPQRRECQEIVELVRRLTTGEVTIAEQPQIEEQIDRLVESAFGLSDLEPG
jgi:adenine-specific DNA-methyltransferase